MTLTPFELAALHHLSIADGLYGSDFPPRMSAFWFVRSRIYTALENLVLLGLIFERRDSPLFPNSRLQRVRHYITARGLEMVQ